MKCLLLFFILVLNTRYVAGVCLRQLNTRYMNHFDAFKLSEKECRDKCDITPLCFTATWTAGQAAHDYYNCFLHQSTFKSQDFVGFIGYICKVQCQKDGQKFTSQLYQMTRTCKEKCTCTLNGDVLCENVYCTTSIANCVAPEVKIFYKAPISSTCSCSKQVCVVPGNVSIEAVKKQSVVLTCSILRMPWTFNGKNIKKSNKYIINETSVTISNVASSDDGTYSCYDGKLYILKAISDNSLSLDKKGKGSKNSFKIVYIVVPTLVSILIAIAVTLCFVKYKHNQKKERKGAWNNSNALLKTKEAAYSELTGEDKRGEYLKLNANTLTRTEDTSQLQGLCAYEVSPYLVQDQAQSEASFSKKREKQNDFSIQFNAKQSEDHITEQYLDMLPYVGADESINKDKFEGYEVSPDLVEENKNS